jgi:hypothetical protein
LFGVAAKKKKKKKKKNGKAGAGDYAKDHNALSSKLENGVSSLKSFLGHTHIPGKGKEAGRIELMTTDVEAGAMVEDKKHGLVSGL